MHFLSLYSLDNSTKNAVFRYTFFILQLASFLRSTYRLTHLFAVGEDPILSSPATVDMQALFSQYTISSFIETTLTANKGYLPSKNHRIRFLIFFIIFLVLYNPAPTTVILHPKEIRTFVIEFSF